MNLFILLRGTDGSLELVTPPLETGVILPGVTRRSIIELCSTWSGIKHDLFLYHLTKLTNCETNITDNSFSPVLYFRN